MRPDIVDRAGEFADVDDVQPPAGDIMGAGAAQFIVVAALDQA